MENSVQAFIDQVKTAFNALVSFADVCKAENIKSGKRAGDAYTAYFNISGNGKLPSKPQ